MVSRIDKRKWLERLDRVEYSAKDEEEGMRFERMGMAGALLLLAKIDPENEYMLCRQLAEHLLGNVPEPDADDFASADE